MEGRRRGEADRKLALLAAAGAARGFHGEVGVAQDRACLLHEGAAGGCQFDPARLPAKQRRADRGLQRPDLLAQRRLLDAEASGSAGDMAFLGDRDGIAEMAQLDHRTDPYTADMIIQ